MVNRAPAGPVATAATDNSAAPGPVNASQAPVSGSAVGVNRAAATPRPGIGSPAPGPASAAPAAPARSRTGPWALPGGPQVARPAGNPISAVSVPGQSIPRVAPASSVPAVSPAQVDSPVDSLAAGPDVELDKSIAGAWAMIEQGTIDAARRKLVEASKSSSEDIRAEFSLGLVDAVLLRDWRSAKKHFAECVRRKPDSVPSLNNLALVELRTKHESRAVTHWSAALAQGSVPGEVAQNLGRAQALLASKRLALKDSSIKALDEMSNVAATSGQAFQSRSGFRFMGLVLADGRKVGWSHSPLYEDVWCFVCHGSGRVPCPNPACARTSSRKSRSQQGPCQHCQGDGVVACTACIHGKDKDLRQLAAPPGQVSPADLPKRAPLPNPSSTAGAAPGYGPASGSGYPIPTYPAPQNFIPARRGR